MTFTRLTHSLALLGSALCLALATARLIANVHFDQPWHVITSGAEWESLLIVWRRIHGMDAYMDRLAIPYAASVYNWLFYESYAAWSGLALRWLHLDETWLPQVARVFTLTIVIAGIAVSRAHFRRAIGAAGHTLAWLPTLLAVLLMTGPLMGFWIITVRSDLGAMVLEITAAWLFLALYPKRRPAAILALAVCILLSWSFKQNSVYTFGAAVLFLGWRRDFRSLGLLMAVMAAGWGATLALGSELYRLNIMFADFTLVFSAERGLHNLAIFALKLMPVVLALPAALLLLLRDGARRKAFLADDRALFAALGAFVAGGIASAGSFHTGAAENYFFTASFYLTLLCLCAFRYLADPAGMVPRPALMAMCVGWIGLSAALVSVLAGINGVISLRAQHDHVTNGLACLKDAPRPLYADWPYLHLPWMIENNPPFVLSWQYEAERTAGKVFQKGGIGGLAAGGYFATLALSGANPPQVLDGTALDSRYRLDAAACDEFHIFRRRD